MLEGITKRCQGQTILGERTQITWSKDKAVLPTVNGSVASGAVINVAGITGRIRGLKHKRADGVSIRPDLVVIDDPQSDESANSAAQCATRERTLAGAVLGLAGPGKKISGIMPCTVIRPGDMADRMLNRNLHPEWNGERMKLVYSFPDNTQLWNKYGETRADSLRAGRGGEDATEFYRSNREAMDAGAVVAWPERFNPDELSAVQNAMNLKLQDEAAFFSEYQNEPMPLETQGLQLTASMVCERVNQMERKVVPGTANVLTAAIDVQKDLLYYAVIAWGSDFTGHVIDYGTWPDQHKSYFLLREANPTLRVATKQSTLDASLYAALKSLCEKLLDHDWTTEGGGVSRVERCLIDANWGESTEVVYRFAKQGGFNVTPSHGKGIGAAGSPIGDWPRKPGEKRGLNWIQPIPKAGRVRHVIFDSNFWKSFVHARLTVPLGETGALTIYGDRPTAHRMFSDHVVAETKTRTSGRGREVDEWRPRPHKPDNHWLDAVVQASVAASMQGVAVETLREEVKDKKRVSYRDRQNDAKREKASTR